MPKFYVIATPIGNLEDITLRAVNVLKSVDIILCEDTRVTKKLLAHYKINTSTESYHSHSRFTKTEKILKFLEDGKNLALVTDSGTPTISDPGNHLISLVRNKFGEAVRIVPIPGPSAFVAALSVSGFPAQEFVFLGFLPHKKGRETMFKEIPILEKTVVFYESPHRLIKSLQSLGKVLSLDRKIMVARELTKIYEETVSGSSEEVLDYFLAHKEKIRGEFVVVVQGGRR